MFQTKFNAFLSALLQCYETIASLACVSRLYEIENFRPSDQVEKQDFSYAGGERYFLLGTPYAWREGL